MTKLITAKSPCKSVNMILDRISGIECLEEQKYDLIKLTVNELWQEKSNRKMLAKDFLKNAILCFIGEKGRNPQTESDMEWCRKRLKKIACNSCLMYCEVN